MSIHCIGPKGPINGAGRQYEENFPVLSTTIDTPIASLREDVSASDSNRRPSFRLALFVGTCLITSVGLTPALASVQYYYDGSGKLTAVIDSVNGSSIYKYDAVGNILSVSTNSASTLVVAQSSPVSGSVGQTVTIGGTGFVSGSTTVNFNGKAATVSTVTATTITAVVPSGATTGPINVTTAAGTKSSLLPFTVTSAPTPTVTQPASSPISAGSSLTVAGTGFDPNPLNDNAYLNGRPVQVTGATSKSLSLLLPTVGTGPISVRTPNGLGTSPSNVLVQPQLCSNFCFFGSCSYSCTTPAISSSNVITFPAVGSSISGTISVTTGGEVGEILFSATAGQRFAFLPMTSSWAYNGSPGANLQLLGPDGLIVSQTATADGFLDLFDYIPTQTLTETGVYALVLQPGDSSTTGSVSGLIFNVASNAFGSLPVTTAGTSINETLASPGQSIGATFVGTQGQRVSLYSQFSSSLLGFDQNGQLSIVADNGVPEYQSSIGYPGAATDFSNAVTLGQAGTHTYSIEMTPPIGVAASGPSSGAATFTLYNVPPDVTGTILANGQATTGTISAPGQSMVETFSTANSMAIALSTQLSVGGCDIMDVIMSPVGGGQNVFDDGVCFGSDLTQADLIAPGTYTISVVRDPLYYQPSTTAATLTLYNVVNVHEAVLANGVSNSTTTTTPRQEAIASLNNTLTGQVVAVQAVMNTPGYYPCDEVIMFAPPPPQEYDGNSNGSGIWSASSGECSNANTFYSNDLTLSSTGSYTVDFIPEYASSTQTLTIYPVSTKAGTLQAVGTPGTLTGSSPAENYLEIFKASSAQTVTLTSAASFSGFIVKVTNQTGTQLYYSTQSSNSDTSTNLTLSSGGTYSILLEPTEPASGSATFTLNSAGGTQAIRGLVAGQGSPSFTPDQNGALSMPFEGAKGQRVALLTDTGNPSSEADAHCFSVDVIQPNGQPIYHQAEQCGGDFSGVLSTGEPLSGLPATGRYFVRYAALTGSDFIPRFTLYNVPSDQLMNMAQERKSMRGVVSTPGQAIRLGFVGTKNEAVALRINARSQSPGAQCAHVSVLDEEGALLVGELACGRVFNSLPVRLPQSGTYTAIVQPTGTTIGSYDVSLFN